MAEVKPATSARQRRVQTSKDASKRRKFIIPNLDSESEEDDEEWRFVYEDQEEPEADEEAADEVPNTPIARSRPKRQAAKSRNARGRIVAACQGSERCELGDCVMVLNDAGRNEAWTGMISGFEFDENHLDGEPNRVFVKWFANPSEVPPHKRRDDVLEVREVYWREHVQTQLG